MVTLLFDIPSSFLADKFGRKKLIVLGVLLIAFSMFFLFFAHGFWPVTLAYALNAVGISFFSGSDQAVLYDSLKELGQESSVNRVAGKYFSSASLPKIVMPLIGSYIARNLLPSQFLILVGIDLVGTLAALIIALKLTEPRVKDVSGNTLGILKEGFKLVASDGILLKFALNKITVFQGAFVYWRVYQVVLQNAQMPILFLGAVYTVFQGIMFLTHWNTEKVQKFVGLTNFAFIPPVVGLIGIILTLVSTNLVVLFISCVAVIMVGTFRDPFFLTQMQSRIPSFNRATATSTLNTIKNISDIPILLTVGYLAKININYVLIASGLLFLVPIVFMRIKRQDLAVHY
jgi:MFS family permease